MASDNLDAGPLEPKLNEQKIDNNTLSKELDVTKNEESSPTESCVTEENSDPLARDANHNKQNYENTSEQVAEDFTTNLKQPQQDDELNKLHQLCKKFSKDTNHAAPHEDKRSEITDSILQLLVTEDMSSIRSCTILKAFFTQQFHQLPPKVLSEVLSVLIAIVKKSVFHLESARGLLIPCIDHLLSDSTRRPKRIDNDQESPTSLSCVSLTKHFLREWVNLLIAHSCDVEELKSIIRFSELDPSLLHFIQQANLKQRNRPPSFFAFPGTKGSMMSLPPFQKWPTQVGWSFSTWFFLEPKACAQPYLYNFKTGKSGLGYSAHFTGNCLVLTSIRVKGKGVQHCVAYEFPSYKWIHCAITYHNKWRASDIKVYVNGQLSANIDMPWQVQTTEIFDKCFIGGSGSITSSDRSGEVNSFCGQMSAIYLFDEGLSPAQICAIHRLGPSYMGQFKYSNESHVNLPPQVCKVLYEDRLASMLFCLFTPVAVDSGTLCIQLAPLKSSTTTSAQNYFVSAPHAALLGKTKAIITQSICSTLQSLGCSRSLLPLLEVYASKCDSEACSSLIGFLCDLLESSPHWFANEIVQNNGFVMVACTLASNARQLISDRLLDTFLNLTRTLLTTSSTIGDSLLLKHLMDNILFNPTLWIYAETKLQVKLYSYLATEFLHGTRHSSNKYTISNTTNSNTYVAYNPTSNAASAICNQNYAYSSTNSDDQTKSGTQEPPIVTDLLFGEIRRVSTVLQSLHALKYFYWIVEEKGIKPKTGNLKLRPNQNELSVIRSHILLFTKELILRANITPLDEIQGLLNYLSTCSHPENLLDVLTLLESLLREHPTSMVSALDQKQGIKVLFTLIGSRSERVRIEALKLLGLTLSHCSHKKKQDIMGPNNLFTLLCDKLRAYKPLTRETYETLFDLMTESDSSMSSDARDLSKKRIENSVIVKVIATLLYEERCGSYRNNTAKNPTTEGDIKKLFINDLWNLIVSSKENRRIILQMSVWQHWLINLVHSTIDDSQLIRDQVLSIFRVLLYHAIRYEYGGWRVWIDTLAIIHTKVSYDEFFQRQNADLNPPMTPPFKDSAQEQSLKEQKAENDMSRNKSPKEDTVSVEIKEFVEDEGKDSGVLELPKSAVSSISERVPRVNSGIQMDEKRKSNDLESEPETNTEVEENLHKVELPQEVQSSRPEETSSSEQITGLDTVDIAPSRAFRKLSFETDAEEQTTVNGADSPTSTETNRQQSMTSIPLEEASNDSMTIDERVTDQDLEVGNEDLKQDYVQPIKVEDESSLPPQKIIASPAFRIPEFKWSNILIKLLNDLMFSIECDLYYWRCSAKCTNMDTPPFAPKSSAANQAASNAASSTASRSSLPTSPALMIETIIQKPENQIYIVNIVHFVSQLADNIIIACGGLLPLLADATGGGRNSSSSTTTDNSKSGPSEGLSMPQANSLLYRLISIVDIVIFAASHINLAELEADKNTTSGGILRQCLRLACTVTVKNCLIVRSINNKIASMGIGGEYIITSSDFPKGMFSSYHGCSLLSANGLFKNSTLSFENSDLIADIEYSPNQTPNTTAMPSLLPFQAIPTKDPNKLLQSIDISRIQACIYYDLSTESRQSQFLALSSLYFISVLMVSKYRDIIEPKQRNQFKGKSSTSSSLMHSTPASDTTNTSTTAGFRNGSSISNIEANLLSFGRIQPNSTQTSSTSNSPGSTLTDMLTTKLENTLDTVCPLLKSIMCDFCTFLSKTLIGSHGQDLVNKETDRTFKRANTSPVELVMLLCSQEWQNTLQKNAGLAFIELINEGRVLSHGMKDHIVRVAMEAEFIMNRLRADDVAKHENFSIACAETLSARLHEEVLINSLISSATRRDYVIYCKFKESIQKQRRRNFKLDIWEDDDRRKRRFVIDSWDDTNQKFYSMNSTEVTVDSVSEKTDTSRILDLQQTIELSGIDDHCSPAGTNLHPERDHSQLNVLDKEDECDEDDFEEDDQVHNDSNTPDSENEHAQGAKVTSRTRPKIDSSSYIDDLDLSDKHTRAHNLYNSGTTKSQASIESHDIENSTKNQVWDYDDCGSVNEFTGSVIFAAECSLVWNIYAIPGVIQLTSHELYFEPNQNISEAVDALKKDRSILLNQEQNENSLFRMNMHDETTTFTDQILLRKIDLKVLRYCEFLTCNGKVSLSDIRAIFSRHFLLQPHALEIFLAQRTSVMFAFSDFDTVKRAVKYLPPVGVGIKYGIPQSRRASLMAPRQLFAASNMTQKWQRREIGNFQYLMFLNTIAGRTYQDLNQYPVFPWVLTNYESDELDLNLPSNFRDLSKPVGALNNKRRSEFVERYQSWDNPKVPAFHYGTHYSTAAFTLNWLCRLRGSSNSAYLALQDGKYEEESRLFLSIGDSWVSSLTGGQQNVKELIPEFFYLPEMFHSNLGLPEVEYPPWAKSAEQFVRIHRLALESELVSCQLHQWIDLVFGYKQRGPEAINAVNTFYYLTYQGNVNLNMIQDPSLRDAIEAQIKHFGQTPSQLTTEPHPPRFSALHVSPLIFSSTSDVINKVVKFPFNTSIIHISSCINNYVASNTTSGDGSSTGTIPSSTNANLNQSSILTVTSNNQYQIHKWTPNEQSSYTFTIDPQLEHPNTSRRQLIDIDDLCSGIPLKLHNQSNEKELVDEVLWPCTHHVVTLDGRYIIMGSFYDNSFRVFTTDSGKLCQVIYGHRAPITCIARSDGNAVADFYIATGSQDCSLLLWSWNDKYAQIEGSGVSAVHNPLPKLTISGHQTPVLSVVICAELGLIISGSKNLILVHTTTSGENLLEIDVLLPRILEKNTLEGRTQTSNDIILHKPQVKDKQKTILEASMLGQGFSSSSGGESNFKASRFEPSRKEGSIEPVKSTKTSTESASLTPTPTPSERFTQLKELCKSDYYIVNLQVARELAFIVCIALPPPKQKSISCRLITDESEKIHNSGCSAALLMTFNLKGSLIDSTTIGHSLIGPKLGDTCTLQTTKDGEHLILNDSPTTLKIYRTFDLQPVFAYNTVDVPNTISDDQSRIKSLALLDHKYILAGLENGKLIIYNVDFKNYH